MLSVSPSLIMQSVGWVTLQMYLIILFQQKNGKGERFFQSSAYNINMREMGWGTSGTPIKQKKRGFRLSDFEMNLTVDFGVLRYLSGKLT